MRDAKIDQIRELALFRDCRPADVEWIARVADTVDLPAGRTLVSHGRSAREFIVLVRGSALSANGSKDVTLAPGAYFGDRGLIDGRPHRITVTTNTPVRLLVFGPGAFRGMLEKIPSVGQKILSGMVSELRAADQDSRSLRAVS